VTTLNNAESPSLRQLFWIWLSLGAQSFGGGTATLALIRREVVERQLWMDDSEFVRDWALCQIAPGINLLGLTILIGKRMRGVPGVALALAGLLIPSTAITVVITAFYAHFRDNIEVQAALHGIIPATVGVGFLTAFKMAWPLIIDSRRQGLAPLLVAIGLLLGSALTIALFGVPVVLVLLAAGALGGLFQVAWVKRQSQDRSSV
jgi:chromate transporter